MNDKVLVARDTKQNISGKEKKMKVSTQIKKYRNDMKFSQEELAEKVYVSRQTISNWETGKSYPNVHSLLLLSLLFNVSLDQLIKGDVEIMKKEIKESEIKKYGNIYSVLLILSLVLLVPFIAWIGLYGLIPWGVLYVVTMYFAFKVEKIKKENNIFTYKEIVAFTEGKLLDEMETQQELGKHLYQRILLVISSAAVGFIICFFMAKLFPL